MATTLNNVKIALRIDDLSNWNNSTLILNDGEIALIRMPSNEIKMKCGDGTSLISSLSYVNETEFYSHIVKANSLNIGLDQTNVVDPSTYSAVHGMKLSAYGQFSEVHGVHAKSNSSDSYAYVWNGNIGSYYQSNGEGSFSLNPKNGLSGIYVGQRTLADILADKIYIDGNQSSTLSICHISQKEYHDIVISDKGPLSNTLYIVSSDSLNMYGEKIENLADGEISSDAVNMKQLTNNITDFQVIRPYFIQNALKLRVKLFSNQEMTDLVGEIDSSDIYMAAFFNNNEQQSWIDFTPNGLEENFSNRPVLVKLSNWLSDNNLKYQFERLFISYEWYYIKDSIEHISDKYSIVVPSYTEVGANSSDTVSKTEYDSLVANIRKDIYSPTLNDDGMYVCYDNKTNIFDHSLSGVIQIILDSFESYKQYDIKFTAGNDLKFEFYKYDYLNGVEFDDSWNINKEYEFIEGITYLIKIKHDLIQIVESTYPTKNLSYKLVTVNPESDGTTYNIKNRTISTIRISDGDTPITINMPNAINGGFARDFILRIEIASSTAPFCTFTGMDSSWLAESEDDEWYILKPGTNVISFTEMAQ